MEQATNIQEFPETFKRPVGKRDFNDMGREEGFASLSYIKKYAVSPRSYLILEQLSKISGKIDNPHLTTAFEDHLSVSELEFEEILKEVRSQISIDDKTWKSFEKSVREDASNVRGRIAFSRFDSLLANNETDGIILNSSRPKSIIISEIKNKLATHSDIYRHGSHISIINQNTYTPVDKSSILQSYFAEHVTEAYYLSINPKDYTLQYKYEFIPSTITESIINAPTQCELKEVKFYSKSPLLDKNYSIISPGYNSVEKIYCTYEPIPRVEGQNKLLEFLNEWNWADTASRDNFIVLLLAAFVAHLFLGSIPLGFIFGNQPNLGKSFIAYFYAYVFEGFSPGSISLDQGDEDVIKQIVTNLKNGSRIFLYDNIKKKRLSSATLEALSTNEIIELRVLGSNTSIKRANNLQQFFTMNEGEISRDLLSRGLPMRLHYDGDPETKNWKHPDFKNEVLKARKIILGELLNMWKVYVDNGSPLSNSRHRFIRFSQVLGGVMECNGYTEHFKNLKSTVEERDDETLDFKNLLYKLNPSNTYTAKQIVGLCMANNLFKSKLATSNELSRSTKCANILSRFEKKEFLIENSKRYLEKTFDVGLNQNSYRVREIPTTSSGTII